MKKALLTIFFVLFIFLLFAKSTLAQGTYTCQASPAVGCQVGVGFQYNNCESGYRPGGECANFNFTSCKGTFPCVKDTGQSSCEKDLGGVCRSFSCDPNETKEGLSGQLGCTSPGICCVPKTDPTTSTSTSDITCGPTGTGINTAIGCIPIGSPSAFLGFILKWAVGVGGGIAFLLIVYSSFMIMTSSGNPERLKAGQELLTSALSGLILLIFSIFILRFIGVDILKIPGFGQSQ